MAILIDFRNTPTQGIKTSPAQRLFNRRTKTLLPTTSKLLRQRQLTSEEEDDERERIIQEKLRIAQNYNKSAKELKDLTLGATVRIQPPPGEKIWKKGVIIGKADDQGRSYHIKTKKGVYRRNRAHLRSTKESAPNFDQPSDNTHHQDVRPLKVITEPVPEKVQASSPKKVIVPNIPTPTKLTSTRSSTRESRPPVRFNDYVKK